MTVFLALATLMTLGAVALVLRRAPVRGGASRAAANAMIHAGELELLDLELAQGTLGAEAHRAARDEILRRVIAEGGDEEHREGQGRLPVAAIALAVPLVAAVLYLLVGNPAALRVHESSAVAANTMPTAAALEDHLRNAPRDGRAWVLLARLHMDADRYGAAAHAYEQALAVAPKIALDPQIWCEWADAVGMAQGGTLRGEPQTLIAKALALKADHPRALEMAGSAAYEAGRHDVALMHWEALLAQLAPGSQQHRELDMAVARVRAIAHGAR